MDVGTAKPAMDERGGVPHHLLDLRGPDQPFSAAEWSALADEAIASIIARGRLPFVVGGTGFYLRALLEGLFEASPVDPAVRARLRTESAHPEGLVENEPDLDDSAAPGSLWALIEGFSPHAATHVDAEDRQGLERLLRYGARPGFSQKRLSLREDGRVLYRFRKPRHTGQGELVREPIKFLRRLAAILPPPRQNQVRFHGIFASRARTRAGLAALLPSRDATPPSSPLPAVPAGAPLPRRRKLLWASLLRRVFAHDVLVCPRCEGSMRLIAVLTDPEIVRGILRHLGLPADPPTVPPARAPPQPELFERPS